MPPYMVARWAEYEEEYEEEEDPGCRKGSRSRRFEKEEDAVMILAESR